MNSEKERFATEKLNQVFSYFNKTQEDFAYPLNIKRAQFGHLLSGKTKISHQLITSLNEVYGINPNYFFTEDAPMFEQKEQTTQENAKIDYPSEFKLSDIELARQWYKGLGELNIFDFGGSLDPNKMIDEEFIEFVNELKEDLEISAELRARKSQNKRNKNPFIND